ncbi:MAG: hypothetical protein AAB113_01500, partial [Candidatus Eisenbacteria bacterium]
RSIHGAIDGCAGEVHVDPVSDRSLACAICLALALAPSALRAQAQNDPCRRGSGNRALRAQLRAGAVPRVRWSEHTPWSWQSLATSFRWPDDPAPPRGQTIRGELIDEHFTDAEWTCEYAGFRAWDVRHETAWCEGAAGDGIGEVVLALLEGEEPEILVGDARSDSAFAASNRPRRVRVYLLLAREQWGTPMEGSDWRRLRVLGTHVVELADTNEMRRLPLPTRRHVAQAMSDSDTHFVAVEIVSVYRGGLGRHTCISEIQ